MSESTSTTVQGHVTYRLTHAGQVAALSSGLSGAATHRRAVEIPVDLLPHCDIDDTTGAVELDLSRWPEPVPYPPHYVRTKTQHDTVYADPIAEYRDALARAIEQGRALIPRWTVVARDWAHAVLAGTTPTIPDCVRYGYHSQDEATVALVGAAKARLDSLRRAEHALAARREAARQAAYEAWVIDWLQAHTPASDRAVDRYREGLLAERDILACIRDHITAHVLRDVYHVVAVDEDDVGRAPEAERATPLEYEILLALRTSVASLPLAASVRLLRRVADDVALFELRAACGPRRDVVYAYFRLS